MAKKKKAAKLLRTYPTTDPLKKERVERNDPCPCGSGLKYKKCCEGKGNSLFRRLMMMMKKRAQ